MSYQAGEDEDEDQTQDTGEDTAPETDSAESDDSDESPDDEGPEEVKLPASEAAPSKPQEQGPPVSASALTDDQKWDLIKQHLSGQYDQASDNGKVKAARDAAEKTSDWADIGHGLDTMFHAKSAAFGGPGADKDYWKGLKAEGQQKVQNAEKDRDAAIKDFMTKNQIGRQAVDDSMKQTSFHNEQDKSKVWKDENTPGSETSKRVISSFNKTFPQFAIGADDAQHLSAADVKGYISGNVDIAAKIQANKEAQQGRMAWQGALKQDHLDHEQQKQDVAFAKAYSGDEAKYQDQVGKIDQTLSMVDQAAKGGVASQLVPLEVAREIAGRLNPQEIAAASGDPSTLDALNRYITKAQNGTMTVKDAQEYRTLLQSKKDMVSTVREKQRAQSVGSYANATKRDANVIRGIVTVDQPSGHQTASTSPSGPQGGSGVANAAPAHGADDKITTYAAAHNLSYEAAKAILVKRGYQPNEQ